ncbi:lipoprotein [Henriciella sp.]|uniref:LPS translocon maturation chaperone LptM n=1 Tax=Henriciella sp. TaxID=1968823 RepID=UPI002633F41D|nr:lipoprotein [Henriciella sp.]
MRRPTKLILALSACAMMAACGIRGDLERPPPIFSDPPDEEAMTPVASPVELALGPEKGSDEAYYNELGGEIPKPDPAADVGEGGLGDIEPG